MSEYENAPATKRAFRRSRLLGMKVWQSGLRNVWRRKCKTSLSKTLF